MNAKQRGCPKCKNLDDQRITHVGFSRGRPSVEHKTCINCGHAYSRKWKSLSADRAVNAEALASRWLADGNVATTAKAADYCYAKAQFWLDRANYLRGLTDRPAPQN